jgi:hypothetical protein
MRLTIRTLGSLSLFTQSKLHSFKKSSNQKERKKERKKGRKEGRPTRLLKLTSNSTEKERRYGKKTKEVMSTSKT